MLQSIIPENVLISGLIIDSDILKPKNTYAPNKAIPNTTPITIISIIIY